MFELRDCNNCNMFAKAKQTSSACCYSCGLFPGGRPSLWELKEEVVEKKSVFEDARVGSHVWDFRWGGGTVRENTGRGLYPIVVTFGIHYRERAYTLDGFENSSDLFPALFWDEVKIVAPERPKRKVKKWQVLYRIDPNTPYTDRTDQYYMTNERHPNLSSFFKNYPVALDYSLVEPSMIEVEEE